MDIVNDCAQPHSSSTENISISIKKLSIRDEKKKTKPSDHTQVHLPTKFNLSDDLNVVKVELTEMR